MVCFSLIANERLRRLNTYMFNDSLMCFYLIFATYLIVIHRMPKLASFFITISISLKVGALLILPSFLGIVQYQYGIYNLLAVISIIDGMGRWARYDAVLTLHLYVQIHRSHTNEIGHAEFNQWNHFEFKTMT